MQNLLWYSLFNIMQTILSSSQVIFEGVFGGELGDIAIDDIAIHEGECPTRSKREKFIFK